MTDHDERRKYKRVSNNFNVKINLKEKSSRASSMEIGKSTNVSACGILLTYDKALEVGDIINIKFMKPNSFEIFSSDAKVVRVDDNGKNGYEVAAEFINISQDDEKKLDYILSR